MIIDVSHNNGPVNWKQAKSAGVLGAILKATEGATVADRLFLKNAKGCADNGLQWGAYHFATWNMQDVVADATQEANFFLSRVAEAVKVAGKPSLPLVLDTETNKATLPITGQQLETYMTTFLSIIDKAGFDTAIYMSPGFSWFLPKNHKLGNRKIWVADYTPPINNINGWKKVWLHQYTDKGRIAGVSTWCDLNRFV